MREAVTFLHRIYLEARRMRSVSQAVRYSQRFGIVDSLSNFPFLYKLYNCPASSSIHQKVSVPPENLENLTDRTITLNKSFSKLIRPP